MMSVNVCIIQNIKGPEISGQMSEISRMSSDLMSHAPHVAPFAEFHPVAARYVVFIINAVDSFWKVKLWTRYPRPVGEIWGDASVNTITSFGCPYFSILIIPQ